jgi:hypothetical protein
MVYVEVGERHTLLIHEVFELLGYYASYFVENQPTFQKNISLPSSGVEE